MLGCVEGPAVGTYADLIDYELRNNLAYLGRFLGAIWYLPRDIETNTLMSAANLLRHRSEDNAALRLAVYQLWLVTKHEKMSEADRDAMILVYVDRLASYPPAAVQSVLALLATTAKFFPAWSEIDELLGEVVGDRHQLLAALRRAIMKLQQKGTL